MQIFLKSDELYYEPVYLVVIVAGHGVGERDLGLEHFPAVHQLH